MFGSHIIFKCPLERNTDYLILSCRDRCLEWRNDRRKFRCWKFWAITLWMNRYLHIYCKFNDCPKSLQSFYASAHSRDEIIRKLNAIVNNLMSISWTDIKIRLTKHKDEFDVVSAQYNFYLFKDIVQDILYGNIIRISHTVWVK